MPTEHARNSEQEGLWLTVTELAALKGIGKPAVSERVARLEAAGLIATRPGKGRAKLVNVAAYDRAVSQTADLARTTGAATKRGHAVDTPEPEAEAEPAATSASAVYTREQARHMAYKADMAQIELEERRGRLMRADKVLAGARESGALIVQALNGLVHHSDALTVAATTGGERAVRNALKKAVHDLRVEIADIFATKAKAAPDTDPGADDVPLADPADLPDIREAILATEGPDGTRGTPSA